MRRILVTGSDGFIGSHLTEQLVLSGYDVKAFVFYNSFNSWGWLDHCNEEVKGNFEVFAGDIRDPFGVKEAMKGCDYVMHLAALIAIPFSYYSPSTYVDTNVKGTLNILQAAKELEVNKLIHTSTSEVYGTAIKVPIKEDHPIRGQSPYSATKIAADQMAYSFFTSYSLPVITLRPFNTYGPRQSARAVIPTIITQIAKGERDLNLGALSPTRDFNYVLDTVNAYISVIKSDRGIGDVFNIGSNFEISIGEVAKIISEVMQEDISIRSDKERFRPPKSEVQRLWADNTKFKNTFDWNPKYASKEGFKSGIKKTIDWFIQDDNLSKYKEYIYNV